MLLLGMYSLVNHGGGEAQVGDAKKEGLFSADGPATVGQSDDSNDGWGPLFSTDTAKESLDDRTNVTKNVAKAAFVQMKQLDQQGQSPFSDASNIDASEMQATIEGSLNGTVDSFFGNVAVSDHDIKISKNNTKAAKIVYLKRIESILNRNQIKDEYKNPDGGIQGQINTACTDGDSGVNRAIAAIYVSLAREFTATRVPSAWVAFHKQVITHYKKGNLIFSGIANCVDDPINGFAAAQKVASFGMESITVQNLLKKMYNEVGL